jgi:HK97 gp10 family phage protein
MARPPNKRLIGNRKSKGPGTSFYEVQLIGANTLMEHFWVMGQLWDSFAPGLLEVTGEIGIEIAREHVPVDTGETRDSINMDPGVIAKSNIGEYSIRVGPTTFYSPFLEYGTMFMAPRPFMMIAGDAMERIVIKSTIEFIKLVDTNTAGMGFGGGADLTGRALSDSRVRSPVSGARTFLYSTSKALGDIAVFGGREFLGPIRGSMLSLAKGLGDVGSAMTGTIGTRVSNRLRGRAIGHLSGFGSASLTAEKTYSGFAGGSAGHRVYARVAGRYGNLGFSGTNLGQFR